MLVLPLVLVLVLPLVLVLLLVLVLMLPLLTKTMFRSAILAPTRTHTFFGLVRHGCPLLPVER